MIFATGTRMHVLPCRKQYTHGSKFQTYSYESSFPILCFQLSLYSHPEFSLDPVYAYLNFFFLSFVFLFFSSSDSYIFTCIPYPVKRFFVDTFLHVTKFNGWPSSSFGHHDSPTGTENTNNSRKWWNMRPTSKSCMLSS